MKKERNITLTLNKAKEWYKKGGELKEIALQAFTEEELTAIDLPKSWEEYITKHPLKYVIIPSLETVEKNIAIKYTNKFTALLKLIYLRDCYRQDWKPDYNNHDEKKYNIMKTDQGLKIDIYYFTAHTFSFQSKKVAKEFLNNFKPLLKQAEDLI